MATIDRFSGQYRFLSNFYPSAIKWEGDWYPTVEHAYQAAKFPSYQREPFQDYELRPGEAKRLGRGKGGPHWHKKSLLIMLELVRIKFMEPKLRHMLLNTKDTELVEGNNWHDNFYGVCSCPNCHSNGSNNLGKILMRVREEIKDHANP